MKREMLCKYDLEATGYINAISQLKGKVHNSSLQLKSYEQKQFQQNKMLRINASQFYKELNGADREENISQNLGVISGVYHQPITMMLGGYQV